MKISKSELKFHFKEIIDNYERVTKERLGHTVFELIQSKLTNDNYEEVLNFITKDINVKNSIPFIKERVIAALLSKGDIELDSTERQNYLEIVLSMDEKFKDPFKSLREKLLYEICMTSLDLKVLKKLRGKIKNGVYKYRASNRIEYLKNNVYENPPKDHNTLKTIFDSILSNLDITEEYRSLCAKHKHDEYLQVYSKDIKPFVKSLYSDFKLLSADNALVRIYYIRGVPITLRIYFKGLIEMFIYADYTTSDTLTLRFRDFMPPYAECMKRDLLPAPSKKSIEELNMVIPELINLVNKVLDLLAEEIENLN